jgi:hypothetical protein
MQTESATLIQLNGFCQRVQNLDERIRFAGLADYAGKLVASYYRTGLVPLMDRKATEEYAVQTVFRSRTRGGYRPQLGQDRYATTIYEKLIRATIAIASPEAEHHNMYLLISLDVGREYANIIEEKVLPFISIEKNQLFKVTRLISCAYVD